MDDGIGLLVSQAAGPDYQTRCNEYVDEHGRLNVSFFFAPFDSHCFGSFILPKTDDSGMDLHSDSYPVQK